MRPFRESRTGGFSEELKELAERIAEADGITPLGPGERRPQGYYSVGLFTVGKKPLPPPKTGDDKR
jgi:hypothetical protein